MFADNSYSKPYFVTYLNTACFTFFLCIPVVQTRFHQVFVAIVHTMGFDVKGSRATTELQCSQSLLADRQRACSSGNLGTGDLAPSALDSPFSGRAELKPADRLTSRETLHLSFKFCLLWFAANYSIAAGLEYTSVASSTILVSTSSAWTLIIGSSLGVESFSLRKLFGVLISLLGVSLVSEIDLSGESDNNRGTFPHKSAAEIAVGDILSLGSAVLYGIYSVLIKRQIQNESRINMLLFFGYVGAINTVLLWPGLILLHVFDIESFELPPSSRIWSIIIVRRSDA